MRPVSEAFLRTVHGSHTMLARATVCTTFQTGTSPTGTRIPILGGDVQLDGTADIRSTLDLTTDGNGMWPRVASDLLAPYGNEIYVERGIRYSDELVEYVGLGYFRIQSPEQDTVPNGEIRIAGRDRMAGIVDGRLLKPVQFLAGTTLGTVVSELVLEVYPDAVIVWDDNAVRDSTLARSVITEEDRYGFLDDLIRAQGKLWYWDHRGRLAITEVPDPGAPVFSIESGAGGVLVSMSRNLTRDGVYNAVVASGEGTDTETPVRAVAIDNRATSPTYYYGRFGPVPRYYTSPFLATDAQAYAAASAILRRGLGLPYSVDLTAVPNPALEPWDPVMVRPSRRDGTEIHVLESLTIPLVAGTPLTASTREQTVILIGSV